MRQGIFDAVTELPDANAKRRFESLVGMDEVKRDLLKQALVLLDPTALERWKSKYHPSALSLNSILNDRAPLFLFAGDVGTGKTVLAETIGDAVARALGIDASLYSLSLSARGTGAVGEMTALIAAAFSEIHAAASKGKRKNARPARLVIMLIDEADALAQSREMSQMHHEDRAGVNAIIRGVDDLATEQLPALVIMCTNRLNAIDPAVRRRAAVTVPFSRPNDEQRAAVLGRTFRELSLSGRDIDELVRLTGPSPTSPFGFTYSDLVQRFIPAVVLDAFPERPVSFDSAMAVLKKLAPTPPFKEEVKP